LEKQPDVKAEAREMTRVQLEMPPKSMERLRLLQKKTEASSYAEVMRNALRFYEFLVEQAEVGNGVYVKDVTGEEKKVVIVAQ
jgi:Ribbon-helix-helix protein, copG family